MSDDSINNPPKVKKDIRPTPADLRKVIKSLTKEVEDEKKRALEVGGLQKQIDDLRAELTNLRKVR